MISFTLLLVVVSGVDNASAFIPIRPTIRNVNNFETSRRSGPGNTKLVTTANEHGEDNDDLCDKILGSALEKMNTISQAHKSSSTATTAAKYNKRRSGLVEVKESSIAGAGLGLFAKKKIKAGTIISFYPAHKMGIYFGETGNSRSVSVDGSGGKHYHESNQEEDDATKDNSYIHYIIGKRLLMTVDISETLGGDSLYIDVDPTQEIPSPVFVSHRINDGATVQTNSEEGVLSYYQQSRSFKNCVHVPFGPSPLLATVTTKKVNKGEELCTTYGCSYWLEKLLEEKEEGGMETEMTEAITSEANGVAKDLLKYMRGVALTDANEAKDLQAIFDDAS